MSKLADWFIDTFPEDAVSYSIPDHSDAAASLLELYAKRIRQGEYAPDFGEELTLVARVIARRI
jgi:hypothetical protein